MKLVSIVEGHGEDAALPVLLRRLTSGRAVEIDRPIRVTKGKLVQQGELSRVMDLAALRAGPDGAILLLLDADEDCPVSLADRLLGYAASIRADRSIAVVVAVREFEAWFLAATDSLVARGRLHASARRPADPEAIRDPKGWLSQHMARRYSETLDQPRFAALFDLDAARSCRSFAKLCRDVDRLTQRARFDG